MNRLAIFGLAALLCISTSWASEPPIAIEAEEINTVSGEVLHNSVILIRDGKVEALGTELEIPEGYRRLQAKVVTPGLIDSHSVVGLAGALNSAVAKGQRSVRVQDQDQLERSHPLQPELRALDAYDARERLISWVRQFGVTTLHTGHGPGAVVSGQTIVVKTVGDSPEEASLIPSRAIAVTLGASPSKTYDSPGTRAKVVAMLRQALLEATAYQEKMASDEKPDRNLRSETLVQVLNGELAMMITADRSPEIMGALRLKEEFGLEVWIDSCAECYLHLKEIKAAGVPVLVHPTMSRPSGEKRNLAFDTAAKLHNAGIPFAFQSGYETYVPKSRVLLWEAAMAVKYGLPREAALKAMTLTPATILGLEDLGRIEVGLPANLVLFDGDPFEYTSHVCTVIIDGKVVSDICR